MVNLPDGEKRPKTLEFKIRTQGTGQERQDQRDVSRVFFNPDAILEMGLLVGMPCYLWKIGEGESQRHEGIVWQAYQSLSKNVIQLNKSFQEALGFKYEERIAVAPAPSLQYAPCVIVRDITAISPLSTRDRPHWEWCLEDKFDRAQTVYHGQRFELSLKGPRRSFLVESFKDSEGVTIARAIASFQDGARVQIVDEASPEPEIRDGPPPTLRVPNLAGIEQALAKLNEFLEDFELSQTEPSWAKRSRGVILHGARGMGKSLILKKISETGWGRTFHIDAHTKPPQVRDVFREAMQCPCSIILIHELDLIVSNIGRSLCEEMDRVADADAPGKEAPPNIVIIAEAFQLVEIPSSLRKRGRLNTEILIPVPDADARGRILKSLVPPHSPSSLLTLLERLGERTHAYTGEDLALLLDKACEIARRRSRVARSEGLDTKNELTKEDMDEALLAVRPSAMHDITLQPPKVRWDEIGGQGGIKKALRRAVETPLKYPDLIRRLGATPKKGILLYGPPGCSKTLSAQAMATETGLNFFAVKGAELLNMYVGESERAVREVFARARAASPSIIFFDEIESIGASRERSGGGGRAGGGGSSSSGVNVLTTLLNEMDGIEALKGVTVLAATNKPEALDLALLRPGRFDDLLYVGPPDLAGRREILELRRRRMDWDAGVDLDRLAGLMHGYSGAEIVGVCNAAVDRVVDRALDQADMDATVGMPDLLAALDAVKKQITPDLIERYRRWASGVRGVGE